MPNCLQYYLMLFKIKQSLLRCLVEVAAWDVQWNNKEGGMGVKE